MFKCISINSKKIKEELPMQSFLEQTNKKNPRIKKVKIKHIVKSKK